MRALHHSANREAAAFFEQALEALDHLPKTPDVHGQAIDLCIDLRNALTLLGEPQRILEHLRQAKTLAERIDDRLRLGRVLSFEANCLVVLGQHEIAIEAGHRALDIATVLNDFSLKTATQQYVGRAHHALGDYRRGIEIFGEIVRSLTGKLAFEHFGLPVIPAVFSRSHLVLCLAEVGMFDEALRHADDAIQLAEATNHPDTLLWACRATGLVGLARGDGEHARAALDRALSLCHTYDMPAYSARVRSELGLADAMCGLASEALSHGKQGVENALATKQTVNFPGIILRLGQINLLAGRLKQAEDSGGRALELFRALRERGNEAHTLHLLGDVFRQRDPLESGRAEHAYASSLALAEELGMRPLTARCRFGLGLLYGPQGERSKSRDNLAEAVALFGEMAMTFWLSQAKDELARLA
jgi:tetratricopeptide (TPR) repeat protein